MMLQAALAYVSRLGWAVFPLAGKTPAIPAHEAGGHGHLDATIEPETIRSYWERYRRSNIGVSCIASGFVAIDVDPRHHGARTLAELDSLYAPLPHTVRQRTGGGGEHILFRVPRDFRSRGSIGAGIDVKWRGAIVASPSTHPETGRRYAWSSNHHPLRLPIAEPPGWLFDLLTPRVDASPVWQARPAIEEHAGWGPKPRYGRATLQRACETIEAAPVGQQDVMLNREAYSIGRLIGAGLMPRQLAIDCLIYHALTMSNAPGRRRLARARNH